MGFFNAVRKFKQRDNPFQPENFIYKFLRDGSSIEMNVNALTPKEFEYVVPAGKNAALARLNILIVDGAIEPDKFGGVAALANGVKIEAYNSADALLIDFCDGFPIKTSSEFVELAGVDTAINKQGSLLDQLSIRWTFERAGRMLLLNEGFKFRITLQDDLSTITKFRMMIQGLLLDAS